MVSIEGGFPLGTAVQVGSMILNSPSNGLLLGTNMLSFAASTSDLIAKNSFLVFPSGERQQLVMIDAHDIQPATGTPQISTLDATYSRVEVKYCEFQSHLDNSDQIAALDQKVAVLNNHPVLLIGGKGYGFSDAPLERHSTAPIGVDCAAVPSVSGNDIRERAVALTLPTSTLLASPSIVLKRLLGSEVTTKRFSLIGNKTFSPLSQADRLVLLKQTGDGAEFLLYGSRLKSIKTEPSVTLTPISQGPPLMDSSNDLVYVSLTTDQLKQYKFIVLIRPNEAPEALPIPTLSPVDDSKTKDYGPTIAETVLLDQDTATVTGKGLQDLLKVQFRGKAIAFRAAKDGNSAALMGLRRAGVTGQASLQSIDFFFKPKPIQVKVDVFTQKSQTVPRP